MKTEGSNLFVLTISAFWSSSRWPLATQMSSRRQTSVRLGGRYRQVSLYKFVVHHETSVEYSLKIYRISLIVMSWYCCIAWSLPTRWMAYAFYLYIVKRYHAGSLFAMFRVTHHGNFIHHDLIRNYTRYRWHRFVCMLSPFKLCTSICTWILISIHWNVSDW